MTAVEATAAAVALVPDDALQTSDTVRLFAKRIAETDSLYAL